MPPSASQAARPDGTRKSTSTRLKNPAQSIYQILFPGARGDFEFLVPLLAERCWTLAHTICGSVRSASLLHAFSRSLARHFSSRYLYTASICRHYYIDLPPNHIHLPPHLYRFGGKSPPCPHGISAVSARHPHRVRTAPTPCPHGTHTVYHRAPERDIEAVVGLRQGRFPPVGASSAECQRGEIRRSGVRPVNDLLAGFQRTTPERHRHGSAVRKSQFYESYDGRRGACSAFSAEAWTTRPFGHRTTSVRRSPRRRWWGFPRKSASGGHARSTLCGRRWISAPTTPANSRCASAAIP